MTPGFVHEVRSGAVEFTPVIVRNSLQEYRGRWTALGAGTSGSSNSCPQSRQTRHVRCYLLTVPRCRDAETTEADLVDGNATQQFEVVEKLSGA